MNTKPASKHVRSTAPKGSILAIALSNTYSTRGTAAEHEHAYKALGKVLSGIAGLLGIENHGTARTMSRLLTQACAQPVGAEHRITVALPANTKVVATWGLLSSSCSAEAIAMLQMDDSVRRHLLNINDGVSDGGYTLRLELQAEKLTLSDLGTADRTSRDAYWLDEVLVELVSPHYRKQTIEAEDHHRTGIQFLLKRDVGTFNALAAMGGATLRVWGEGFSNHKVLRITKIFEFEVITPETFIAGERLCDGITK